MKNTLTTRRLKGLFASFIENGAMVSLAGIWNPVKDGQVLPKGALTKEFSVRGKTVLKWLSAGSLADLFGALAWRLILACFPNKVRLVNRLKVVNMFRGYLFSMYRHHGATYTIKYLKASSLAISKAIGKCKLESLRELEPDLALPRLTSSGLPRFIPSRDRRLIIGGSVPVIRFYMTLFSVYRVISIPGTLKLGTITQGPTVSQDSLAKVAVELQSVIRPSMFNLSILRRPGRFLWLETASPSHKVSWTGIVAVPGLLENHGLADTLIGVLTILGGKESLISLFNLFRSGAYAETHYLKRASGIGGLSVKSEPAGKERVFALVDVWTQTALKPIHDMLFAFLRSLPNDGTFDQHASEMRARSKAQKAGFSKGFDLTAATDRVPLYLQISILNFLVPRLGTAWGRLLVERPYRLDITKYLPKQSEGAPHPTVFTNGGVDYPVIVCHSEAGKVSYCIDLRYGTGQPMGALSSWAMLAITHHGLVQISAVRAGVIKPGDWFSNYELLGDDIIIFDQLVADEYLRLMEEIGVPINLSKSVCANNPVTEFAKVTSYYGHNVSPVSWKMFMSQNHLMGRASIAYSMLSRGVILQRIVPWIEQIARKNRTNPGNSNPTFIAVLTMLAATGKIPLELVLKCLINGKVLVFSFYRSILLNADTTRIKQLLPSLFLGKEISLPPNSRVEAIFSYEKPWFGITLWKPLAVFQARLDLHQSADLWTKEVLNLLVGLPEPGSPEDGDGLRSVIDSLGLELDFGSSDVYGAPLPEGSDAADIERNDLVVLYSIFYTMALTQLENLSEGIRGNPADIQDGIPKLVEQTAEKDRFNEFLALVKRAEAKINGTSDVSKARVESPLKAITFLTRMSVRPGFTKLKSFD
jgi:hypothetical protein